jgi:hypothetical protein
VVVDHKNNSLNKNSGRTKKMKRNALKLLLVGSDVYRGEGEDGEGGGQARRKGSFAATMDSDHWISRLMAAKRQYALQRAQRHHATPAASHHGTHHFSSLDPVPLVLTVPGLGCTVVWVCFGS